MLYKVINQLCTSRKASEMGSSNTGCRIVITHRCTNCITRLLQANRNSRSWLGESIR